MYLLNQIDTNSRKALQDKNMKLRDYLSYLYSTVKDKGLNDGKRETTDVEAVEIIKNLIKKAQENLDKYPGTKLAEDAVYELAVLNGYLPKQFTKEEIEAVISEKISSKTLPNIMAYFKANYPGQYDGKLLSGIARVWAV